MTEHSAAEVRKFQDQIIETAFSLWEQDDPDAKELCYTLLDWAGKQGFGVELIVQRILKKILGDPEETKEVKRFFSDWGAFNSNWGDTVLADPSLRLFFQIKDSSSYTYRLPSIIEAKESSNSTDWKGAAGLIQNPFGPGSIQNDPLLEFSRAYPENWAIIEKPNEALIHSGSPQDRQAASLMLQLALREQRKHFIVDLSLPYTYPPGRPNRINILKAVAKAVGSAWVRIIALNPEAYLVLDQAQRAELADLLNWAENGSARLIKTLEDKHRNQDHNLSLTLFLLDDLRQKIGNAAPPHNAKEEDLMKWIAIRPKYLSKTYLIATDISMNEITDVKRQINNICNFATVLQEGNVVTKLFTLRVYAGVPESYNIIPLSWSTENLEKILKVRMQRATMKKLNKEALEGIKDSFDDLFEPGSNTGAHQRIASYANGSLSRMLAAGNKILSRQIEKDPDSAYLDLAILDQVLSDR